MDIEIDTENDVLTIDGLAVSLELVKAIATDLATSVNKIDEDLKGDGQ